MHPYRTRSLSFSGLLQRLHLDSQLLLGMSLLLLLGFVMLYSAGNQDLSLISKQTTRLLLAFAVLIGFANISPGRYRHWAPFVYGVGLTLLLVVLIMGHIGKGAQRWLDIGVLSFQPSEMMKLALPMVLAWYLSAIPLPISRKPLVIASLLILVPVLLTAKQPDLGTAIVISFTGFSVLFLAGIRWKIIFSLIVGATASTPILWHFLHDYQKQRVLTFLNPERDPLGTGYHIIQSKIAIGSGGLFGKGWLNGTQSHLNFLPEHATDFIYALVGEEFGLMGGLLLLILYLFITLRGLYISTHSRDTFSRLLAGSLSLTLFVSAFINIGMVTGLLPVVGIPLPLLSYGGTSLVTVMAGLGILMSINHHRRLS